MRVRTAASPLDKGVAMKRLACLLLTLALPATAFASGAPIQESMLVIGTITVNPDGSVQNYTVHGLDKLPPAARHIIQATVPRWQFVPIIAGGKAIAAKAGMSLRIVADMVDEHHAIVRLAGAAFGCDARPKSNLPGECPAGTAIRYIRRDVPRYPMDAMRARVGGEVFVVVQIGPDGRVTQAAARQVNLYTMSDDQAHYRKLLADSSLQAARRWIFRVPTVGPNAAKDHWAVTVPVNYVLRGGDSVGATRRYGHWSAYLPGPVQAIPWDHEDASGASGANADAIAGGAPFVRDRRFVLKTALGGGASQS